MEGDFILEPVKYYDTVLRELHKSNASSHFNSLVVESGISPEANRETVKNYNKELANISHIGGRLAGYRICLVLLIILAVLGGIAAVLGLYILISGNTTAGLITMGCGAAAILIGILVIVKKLRPLIKENERILATHQARADSLLAEAQAQMAPLNALFDDVDTLNLIEKTMPQIKFDKRYSNEQLRLLSDDFDYLDLADSDTSVIDTLSGKLFGNPFIFERHYRMNMGTFTYSGSKTISWTETYRDSKGNLRTQTRTQVLTATVTKPKPYYRVDTHLGYGSLAAPDLTFSRTGTHVEDLSEAQRERKIRKGSKKLNKKARKAVSKGGSFQEMANEEFDVLFGAVNRNNEVQFRVMYTPLAQQNTVELITTETGYGDDFKFMKQKRFNIIKSEHAQHWQMHVTAAHYRSYSIDEARAKFMNYNESFFKSVYFDFAPLLCVPVYQEEPAESMKTPKAFRSNYTKHEHEALANSIGTDVLKHPSSVTDAILKTDFISSFGTSDRVRITASSFAAEDRLDFIPTLGGDGRIHDVPVHWLEYIPLTNICDMAVSSLDHSERTFTSRAAVGLPSNTGYLHGLMAYTVTPDMSDSDISATFDKYK